MVFSQKNLNFGNSMYYKPIITEEGNQDVSMNKK